MNNEFRDVNIRFSTTEAGIWLSSQRNKPRLLLLSDCLAPTSLMQKKNSNKCVGSRDITKLIFTLSSTPPINIIFVKGIWAYIRTGKTAIQRFHDMQKKLQPLGYSTYDLS